jgi:hypothetical protein
MIMEKRLTEKNLVPDLVVAVINHLPLGYIVL